MKVQRTFKEFTSAFDEDDLPKSHMALSQILESAFFTDEERAAFLSKVSIFMHDKPVFLDLVQ